MDFFNDAYDGVPPWDIGRPQAEFVRLEREGELPGRVLDVGCGTGENILYFAAQGHPAWGIDSSSVAIEKARRKAAERGQEVTFQVHDALTLADLVLEVDAVIDSGLFHVLSDDERVRFRRSLESVLAAGGRYAMLCFSDLQPGTFGPRRVTQAEIRETFSPGWTVKVLREAVLETNMGPEGIRAWLTLAIKE